MFCDDPEGYTAPLAAERHNNALQTTSIANVAHEHLSPPILIFPKSERRIIVIMEPVVEISFEDLLGDDRTGELTEKKIVKIIKQILTAIKFLHQNGIAATTRGVIFPCCEIRDDWVRSCE